MQFIKSVGFLLFCVLCLPIEANAQSNFFSGVVKDAETKEVLIDALVIDAALNRHYAKTDVNGKFSLPAHQEKAIFKISYLGYQTLTLELIQGQPAEVSLQPTELLLNELVVVSEVTRERGVQSLAQVSLEKDLLSRNSNAGLGSVLSSIDGVTFISTGTNIQLPVIHGLYGNRILILNNGFKHGFQNWGNDHAPEVDVSGAERIKVVKGAGGVKYGPDALGGAVIIENNEMALNQSLYGQVTSSYQTNGRGYGVNASLGQGFEKFSYHLGGNFNQIGDRRAPGYMLTNTGAIEYAVQGGLRYSHKNWVLRANYSMVNQNLGILRAAIGSSGPALIRIMEAEVPTFIRDFSYQINEPNQLVRHQIASASLSYFLNDGSKLELRYGKQWNARQEFDVRRNAELPIFDLVLNSDDIQLEWEHSWGEKWTGSWGAQYFSQSNVNNPGTNITPFIPNYLTTRLSVYLLEAYQLGRGTLEAGIRYDFERNLVSGRDSRQEIFRDDFTFSNFSAAIGHVLPVNKNLVWRNNVGTGWRPPNMAELFSFGQHESRTAFGLLRYEADEEGKIVANRVTPLNESNVRPENSIKYTTELEWTKGNHRLNVTAYANYIQNFIFSRPIGVLGTARGPMPTFIVDQSDALFLGADLTYTFSYHKEGKLSLGGSYIWTQNVQRNETLINQPPIHVHVRWSHSWQKVFGLEKIELTLQPSYTFQQFQAPRVIPVRALIDGTVDLSIDDPIFDFQAPPPGYFLMNGSLRAHKGKFSLSVEATNIFNNRFRDYLNLMRYFADEPGVNLIVSLSYKF